MCDQHKASKGIDQDDALVWLPLPRSVWRGILGRYRAYVQDLEGCDAYDLMAFLSCVGILLGRSVYFVYAGRRLYPNLYLVIYGPSGRPRKTSAARRPLEIIQGIDPDLVRMRALSSAEGLLDHLGGDPHDPGPPRRLMVSLEEFYGLLRKARQEAVGNIIPLLTELYDCPDRYELPVRTNPRLALDPTVAIIACSTPEWLEAGLTEEDIAGGFANRFMYITGPLRPPNPLPGPMNEAVRNEIASAVADLLSAFAQPTEISLSPQAKTLWEEFYVDHYNRAWPSDIVGKMAERVPEQVLKVAVIYTALDLNNEISAQVLEAAIAVGVYAEKSMVSLFQGMSLNADARMEQKVLAIVEEQKRIRRSALHQKIGGRVTADRLTRLLQGLARMGRIDLEGKDVVWPDTEE